MYTAGIMLLMTCTLLTSCAAEQHAEGADTVGDAPATTGATSPTDTIEVLIERLRVVGGTFTRTGTEHDYRFDGSVDVVRALSEFGDSAVVRLVECMDRDEPTQTLLNGGRLPLGAMCFDALRRIASYEATDPDGDIDAEWPGYISVDAGRDARIRAQRAWREVVMKRLYRVP